MAVARGLLRVCVALASSSLGVLLVVVGLTRPLFYECESPSADEELDLKFGLLRMTLSELIGLGVYGPVTMLSCALGMDAHACSASEVMSGTGISGMVLAGLGAFILCVLLASTTHRDQRASWLISTALTTLGGILIIIGGVVYIHKMNTSTVVLDAIDDGYSCASRSGVRLCIAGGAFFLLGACFSFVSFFFWPLDPWSACPFGPRRGGGQSECSSPAITTYTPPKHAMMSELALSTNPATTAVNKTNESSPPPPPPYPSATAAAGPSVPPRPLVYPAAPSSDSVQAMSDADRITLTVR